MNRSPLVVLSSRRTLLGTEILVRADRHDSVVIDSLLGKRRFYAPAGGTLRIKVKGRTWPEGYRLSIAELVFAARDWTRVPWRWV